MQVCMATICALRPRLLCSTSLLCSSNVELWCSGVHILHYCTRCNALVLSHAACALRHCPLITNQQLAIDPIYKTASKQTKAFNINFCLLTCNAFAWHDYQKLKVDFNSTTLLNLLFLL